MIAFVVALFLQVALPKACGDDHKTQCVAGVNYVYSCVKDHKWTDSDIPCEDAGLKPVTATVQIQLTREQKEAYPSNSWMKLCGPDNRDAGCEIPNSVPAMGDGDGPGPQWLHGQECEITGDYMVDCRNKGVSGPATYTGYATIQAADGSRVVKLPDDEFDHLQQLRRAVADEEIRLAAKYGANLFYLQEKPQNFIQLHAPDHYEFRGQFLLIEKAAQK
jgi:hypothetical protein